LFRTPLQIISRSAPENIHGSAEYQEIRAQLIMIDHQLTQGGLEETLVKAALSEQGKRYSKKELRRAKYALRCNIARHLFNQSFRKFSFHLTDSELLNWFTRRNEYSDCMASSKSSMHRYESMFDDEILSAQIKQWLSSMANVEASSSIGLAEPLNFADIWLDTTCIEANIHFPVDWVLLRDAARTLLLAIERIREQGLRHRMGQTGEFMRQMNSLCIEMTHAKRKKDSKRQRKLILTKMKKLLKTIAQHAKRYRELLITNQDEVNWSSAQVAQVLNRIDNVLTQLPAAVKQAHERIIGGRLLNNKEKIISLYDHHAGIIVRGKSRNETEFGQKLLLTEQPNGLIINWKLYEKFAPSDEKLVAGVVESCQKHYGTINSVTGDRAFDSAKNNALLKEKGIFNAICPKKPSKLKERLQDIKFVAFSKRRNQTEGRIGIFTGSFIGKPLRTRDFKHKQLAITWGVLAHDLWVLARMALCDKKIPVPKAA
jgi:hypothetical protein